MRQFYKINTDNEIKIFSKNISQRLTHIARTRQLRRE